jgi:hypothetical protein
LAQVFEHEADEDVIEGSVGKSQLKEVTDLEGNIRKSSPLGRALCGLQRGWRDIQRAELRERAASGEDDGLRAHAAARFEDARPSGIDGVVVEQFFQGP